MLKTWHTIQINNSLLLIPLNHGQKMKPIIFTYVRTRHHSDHYWTTKKSLTSGQSKTGVRLSEISSDFSHLFLHEFESSVTLHTDPRWLGSAPEAPLTGGQHKNTGTSQSDIGCHFGQLLPQRFCADCVNCRKHMLAREGTSVFVLILHVV